MHIGLIGGIGPAATDFYYRGLIDRARATEVPLACTIAHADVREMSKNLTGGNPKRQAEIFADLIARLKRAGADVAAVTSMGGHFCINELLPISLLPLVHGIHAVDAGIRKSGLRKIGVLGFSFKAGTDDLRESPMVDVAQALLGRGYKLRIYDPALNLAALVGANKRVIDTKMPHLASLLHTDLASRLRRLGPSDDLPEH